MTDETTLLRCRDCGAEMSDEDTIPLAIHPGADVERGCPVEFGFDGDSYAQGVAAYRIGQPRSDCPFNAEHSPGYWHSWMVGWEFAQRIRIDTDRRQAAIRRKLADASLG